MPIISGGGGVGGATPDLAAVLTEGHDADGTGIDNLGLTTLADSIVTDSNLIMGDASGAVPGDPARLLLDNGPDGAINLTPGSPISGSGGTLYLEGGAGANFATNGALFVAQGGNADGVTHGRARVITANAGGASGQALVSDGANYLVYGGVRAAAAAPVAAPDGVLPFAYDTTAVTGGFYFWNGAAWVKVATIL